jgi:hypothetical protein
MAPAYSNATVPTRAPSKMMHGPAIARGREARRMVPGAIEAEMGMASKRPAVKEPQNRDTLLLAGPLPVVPRT